MYATASFFDCKLSAEFCGENIKAEPYIVVKVPTYFNTIKNTFIVHEPPSQHEEMIIESIIRTKCLVGSESAENTPSVVPLSAKTASHSPLKLHPQSEGYTQIYESEVVQGLKSSWAPFRIGSYELCKGTMEAEIILECYNWNRSKESALMGEAKLNVQKFVDATKDTFFYLNNNQGDVIGKLFVNIKDSIPKISYCDFHAYAQFMDGRDVVGVDLYFVIKAPLGTKEYFNPFNAHGTLVIPPAITKRGKQKHPDTHGFREVYESPIIWQTRNPTWEPFRIGFYDLCRARQDAKIRIECYDHCILSNTLIGCTEISVQSLLQSPAPIQIPLMSKAKHTAATFFIQCASRPPTSTSSSSLPHISPLPTRATSLTSFRQSPNNHHTRSISFHAYEHEPG